MIHKQLSRVKRKLRRIITERNPELAKKLFKDSPSFFCPVCRKATNMLALPTVYLAKMLEHRCIHNIFLAETLNIEHYSCSNCGASDRDRLYALYLEKYLSQKKSISLVDVAPANQLAHFIRQFTNVSYRSTDLHMEVVDDLQDITDMHLYANEQFDFFICSHVLEHIPDDKKAMAELYRILKKGGSGIAMVPINFGVTETLEDPTITDVAIRWKLFGQYDHVRMYAKNNFILRLNEIGFHVELLDINYFGAEVFKIAAIFQSSVLYIVTK